jgi:hypothetical protein
MTPAFNPCSHVYMNSSMSTPYNFKTFTELATFQIVASCVNQQYYLMASPFHVQDHECTHLYILTTTIIIYVLKC